VAGLTLDAGALIAYERGDTRVREILAVAYARGFVPTIPAIALAEVWRDDTIATSDPEDMRTLLGPSFTILAV
jgi:hypothetical protein